MEEIQCSAGSPCTAVQLLVQRIAIQEERIDKMDDLLESMRNRLPLWATMALTGAGGAIGILVGLLVK